MVKIADDAKRFFFKLSFAPKGSLKKLISREMSHIFVILLTS